MIYIPSVSANGDLSVQYRFGTDNRIIPLQTVPVYVDITNKGDAFAGDFVYDNEEIYSGGSGVVLPFEVGSGESVSLKFYIQSVPDSYIDTQALRKSTFIYEGNIEQEKKVAFDASQIKAPTLLNYDMKRMLVISENEKIPKQISAFKDVAFNQLEIVQTTSSDLSRLSNNRRDYDMYEIILIDPSGAKLLSNEQASAIEQWLRQGGKLILTGKVEFEAFPKLLSFGEGNVTVINSSSVPIALANEAIMAQMTYSSGEIVHASIGFEQKAFEQSEQVERILAIMARENDPKYELNQPYRAVDWAHTNGYFDTFHYNTMFIVLLLLAYILIVGPLLYAWLKRKDQREKMWLYIPILAIVTSLLLFIFGASDRIVKPQTQTMELVSLNGAGDAHIDTSYSFVSNKRGDYEISADSNSNVISYLENFDSPSDSIHKKAYTQVTNKEQLLTLRNVPYWSVQGALENTFIQNIGTIDNVLKLENGKLTGTITNQLDVDLQNVMLLSGTNTIEFGAVKAGETIQVDEEVSFATVSKPYYKDYYENEEKFNNLSGKEKMQAYKLDAILRNATNHHQSKGALLVAVSNVAYSSMHLQGAHQTNVLSVLTQNPTITTVFNGKFVLDSSDFEVEADNNRTDPLDLYKEEEKLFGTMFEGDYILNFELPNSVLPQNVTWSELEVKFDRQELQIELYNVKEKTYEPLKASPWRSEKDVTQYLSKDGMIQLKISTTEEYYGAMLKLPTFKLRGEAIND